MILDQINYEQLLVPLNKFYDLHTGGSAARSSSTSLQHVPSFWNWSTITTISARRY